MPSFVIQKDDLTHAVNILRKSVGLGSNIQFDLQDDILYLHAFTDNYGKVNIPAINNNKNGKHLKFWLPSEAVKNFSNLKGKKLNFEIEKEQVVIKSQGLTKLNIVSHEETIPNFTLKKEERLTISSINAANFRILIEKLKFKQVISSIELEGIPVHIHNDPENDKLTVLVADSVHCACLTIKSISNKEFSFYTFINVIQSVCSSLLADFKIYLNNSRIIFISDNLTAVIPSLQVGVNYLDNAQKLVTNIDNLDDNSIIIHSHELLSTIKHLDTIASIDDNVILRISPKKKGKLFVSLRTKTGSTTVPIKIKSSFKDLEVKTPYIYFQRLLGYLATIDKDIELRVDDTYKKYCRLTVEDQKHSDTAVYVIPLV